MQAGFSLEIYSQMMHSRIGRYEIPSLHTSVEMLSGKDSNWYVQSLASDSNGVPTKIHHIQMVLQ